MLSFAQNDRVEWKFLHPVKQEWINAGTHGSVQEYLIQSGELPDPFVGENEKRFGWIENYDWEFRADLHLTAAQLRFDFVELEFPGIDTYAKVYLNGNLMFQSENAFRPYSTQIKKWARVGVNELKVIFTSPVNYNKAAYEARSPKLPTPNDVGDIPVSSMTRKPQYQFGWDWTLRMNTIGFLKPVQLHTYNHNRVLLSKVDTKLLDEQEAVLNISVSFAVRTDFKVTLKSELWGEFRNVAVIKGQLNVPTVIQKPQLWWPRGQGAQHLYKDVWEILDEKGSKIQTVAVRFGVKTSEIINEKDDWGTSFYFKINGKPVFCKGANYIPQDIFPARITAASTQNLIDDMYQSNFNMVRVWGGGFYQDEVFYNTCDELGIMVWQDLMFACAIYPGDVIFLNNVQEELNYQIPRIAAHPSVVLFNGNNEVEVASKYWGFQSKYMIGAKAQKQMDLDYEHLFKKLAPETVAAWCSIPYMHTSPLSHWGKEEWYNHGTQHYWGVWHGKDPIEDFGLKSGRFNAEYGFQSFPEYSTLLKFSKKSDWDLNAAVMKQHQKSYVGNGMIKKHSDILYGESKSFEEFVYFSQLTQAKAVSIAISAHRIGSPRCMGTLYWQLNDCWPATSWSGIDYYGNWKALQYQVKDDFEDVAVLAKTEQLGNEHYYLLSDQPENFATTLRYDIFDLSGDSLLSKTESIFIPGNWQQEICFECRTEAFMSKNYVIQFTWNNAKGKQLSRSFTHIVTNRQPTLSTEVELTLENIDTIAKTAILRIKNNEFLNDFWVYSSETGIRFDRNFLQLLPGEHAIRIQYEQLPHLFNFDMKWR